MHLSVGEVKGTNWEKSADVGTKLGERALKTRKTNSYYKTLDCEHG